METILTILILLALPLFFMMAMTSELLQHFGFIKRKPTLLLYLHYFPIVWLSLVLAAVVANLIRHS